MVRGQSPITIIWFCSFGLNFICCLHLLGYDKITQVWALLAATPSNTRSFPLKLYLYKQLLRLKGATASLKDCGRIIRTKYQSSVVFRK